MVGRKNLIQWMAGGKKAHSKKNLPKKKKKKNLPYFTELQIPLFVRYFLISEILKCEKLYSRKLCIKISGMKGNKGHENH